MADEEQKQDSTGQTKPLEITTEWTDRKKWETQREAELRIACRAEYESLFEIWKSTTLAETRAEYDKITQTGIQKLFDDWKAEQKPPTPEDIQLLLSQEYETFNLPVIAVDDNGDATTETFVIRELPQSAEKKFYKQFKAKILDKVGMLSAFDQENMNATFEDKAKAMLDIIDEGFDVLADAIVIVLNPFNKNKNIDRVWVQQNISSDRQWRILEAQIRVNRLKDFFSKVSLSGQSMTTTMTGQNFQQLQQRVRS